MQRKLVHVKEAFHLTARANMSDELSAIVQDQRKHMKTAQFLKAWNSFSRSQAPSSLELLSLMLIDFHRFFTNVH